MRQVKLGDKWTLSDYGLYLAPDPEIGEAEPKTETVDIPAGSGSLDLTEALTGEVQFKDRDLSFNLIFLGKYEGWQATYKKLKTSVHGKQLNIVMPQYPGYYFTGRVRVGRLTVDKTIATANIKVTAKPFMLKQDKTIISTTIPSNGVLELNLVNERMTTLPTFTIGADGKTPYLHTAYSWSADGQDRFMTVYPGENLLLDTGFNNLSQYWTKVNGTVAGTFNGHNIVYSDAQNITDGFIDVLQQQIYNPYWTTNRVLTSRWYTLSFYAKGIGEMSSFIYPNIADTSAGSYVDGVKGTIGIDGYKVWNLTDAWVRHTLTFKSKSSLSSTEAQSVLFRISKGNAVYICMPKLDEGTLATDYSPSPLDDPEGAYPTYIGTYTDYTAEDSTDPSKYKWAKVSGEQGPTGDSSTDGKPDKDGADSQIVFEEKTFSHVAGTFTLANVFLKQGNNPITIKASPGTSIKVEYQEGSI